MAPDAEFEPVFFPKGEGVRDASLECRFTRSLAVAESACGRRVQVLAVIGAGESDFPLKSKVPRTNLGRPLGAELRTTVATRGLGLPTVKTN